MLPSGLPLRPLRRGCHLAWMWTSCGPPRTSGTRPLQPPSTQAHVMLPEDHCSSLDLSASLHALCPSSTAAPSSGSKQAEASGKRICSKLAPKHAHPLLDTCLSLVAPAGQELMAQTQTEQFPTADREARSCSGAHATADVSCLALQEDPSTALRRTYSPLSDVQGR